MSLLNILLHVLAAFVLAGIVWRLSHLTRPPGGFLACTGWHAWVLANAMIGLGMLSRLFHMERAASVLVTAGLALYFLVKMLRKRPCGVSP